MSFDIQIKVDPGNAVSAIKGVTDGLTAAEAKGKTAGESMLGVSGAFKSMATAMAQEQAALARLSTMHDQLAVKNSGLVGSFAGIAAAIKREQDVLASIRQPQMEYFDTLTALDKLLERNAISTQEYAEQVTQLNRSMGGAPKAEGKGGGIGLGDVAQFVGGGAAGAAVLGIGHQIEDIADSYAKLDDQYTALSNHALKFAEAGRSVGTVMAQQEQLAASLHTTLSEAMDAYDSVQDATVDLGLSEQQLIAATKAVGESSVISGKSMAGAGDVLNRLILAMDSGADAGRALKTALVGYDDLSDMLTRHFHTTRAGLVELGNQHKITSRDIVQAIIEESGAEQEAYDKRKVSIEKETEMLNERIAINLKSKDEMTAVFEAGYPEIKQFNESMQAWGGTLDDDTRATRFLTDEVASFTKQMMFADQQFTKTTDAIRSGSAILATWTAAVVSGKVASDPMIKYLGEYEEKQRTVTEGTKALKQLLDEHRISVEFYKQQMDALTSAHGPLSSEAKLLDQINAPMKEANALIRDSADLYAKGAISVQDWATQVRKAQALAGIDPSVRSVVSGEGGDFFTPFHGQSGTGGVANPNLNEISDAALYKASYASAQTPDPKAYAEFEARARDALSGVDEGWKQILHDSTDSAKQIKEAMTSAFTDIQNSLESMVLKGKFDLGSLGDELEKIAVHLAIQQATGSLMGALGGGMTGFDYMASGSPGRYAFPGFARGGDMLVSGAGAPDSKLAMFRVSPGESIHVRTPEQRAAAAASAGGDTTNNYNFMYDPKAMVKGGIDALQAHMRANPAVYRALLGV
ncbi:MAG TPA: tape measure protein [Kofleriaceae bacterium]|nr:tape measure protein [Kofleriaceae bacterium]